MEKIKITVDTLLKTQSSNISEVAYIDADKKAFVKFKNGGLYEYEDVSKEEFESLTKAESVGKYLSSTFLKKGYQYQKLVNTDIEAKGQSTPNTVEIKA